MQQEPQFQQNNASSDQHSSDRSFFQFVLWLNGGSILLALIGIILGLTQLTGGFALPWWLVVPWATINVLIAMLLIIKCIVYGVNLYRRDETDDRIGFLGFFGLALLIIAPIAIANEGHGVLSAILFVFSCISTIIDIISASRSE